MLNRDNPLSLELINEFRLVALSRQKIGAPETRQERSGSFPESEPPSIIRKNDPKVHNVIDEVVSRGAEFRSIRTRKIAHCALVDAPDNDMTDSGPSDLGAHGASPISSSTSPWDLLTDTKNYPRLINTQQLPPASSGPGISVRKISDHDDDDNDSWGSDFGSNDHFERSLSADNSNDYYEPVENLVTFIKFSDSTFRPLIMILTIIKACLDLCNSLH